MININLKVITNIFWIAQAGPGTGSHIVGPLDLTWPLQLPFLAFSSAKRKNIRVFLIGLRHGRCSCRNLVCSCNEFDWMESALVQLTACVGKSSLLRGVTNSPGSAKAFHNRVQGTAVAGFKVTLQARAKNPEGS